MTGSSHNYTSSNTSTRFISIVSKPIVLFLFLVAEQLYNHSCVSVCLSVCLCVCLSVCHTFSTKEYLHNSLTITAKIGSILEDDFKNEGDLKNEDDLKFKSIGRHSP